MYYLVFGFGDIELEWYVYFVYLFFVVEVECGEMFECE